MQLNVPHLDADGKLTGQYTPFMLCGFLRHKKTSDHAFNRLCQRHGFLKTVVPREEMI